MTPKKPPGYKAFSELTKSLAQVPKHELDTQLQRYEAKKQKRQAKKKSK